MRLIRKGLQFRLFSTVKLRIYSRESLTFQIFGLGRLFWKINLFKGSSFRFVLTFYSRMDVEKSPRVHLLHFSALRDCSKFFFRFFLETFLMSPKSPAFNFFLFCNKMLKNPRGSPFGSSVRSPCGFSGTVEVILDALKPFCYF